MSKLDKLIEYINTLEGLERCLNNEEFYLRLVNKALNDDSYLKLKEEIDNKKLDEAFKIAHSLKGVLGNLSITPMYEIIYELTELLRRKEDIDYSNYLEGLFRIREELLNIIKE